MARWGARADMKQQLTAPCGCQGQECRVNSKSISLLF